MGFKNHLINETSPYLRQHAHQPVDWYPWGEEVFQIAERENKPVFLSIGYSTCHWCHVMAEESFEDKHVADLMNDLFVCIKVDREERPDIDNLYMEVAYIMNGSGGWPLNVIMTPDKKPFFAATYLPKKTVGKMPGMLEMIPRVKYLWKTQREQIDMSAEQLTDALKRSNPIQSKDRMTESIAETVFDQLNQAFDTEFGGFGNAPKFPTAHNLLFLMRYGFRTGNSLSFDMVKETLRFIHAGGIFDQLEGGVHRYSTDRIWKLPHFEKMLYDQATLLRAYTEAYQVEKDMEFKITVDEIVNYVSTWLMNDDGVFYSGEDADSEGMEGTFYLWKPEQIQELLSDEDWNFVKVILDLTSLNDKSLSGLTTLSLKVTPHKLSENTEITKQEWFQRFDEIKTILKSERDKRVRPACDEKVLADWNGLIIAALAYASKVFGNDEYYRLAVKALNYLLEHYITDSGELIHYRGGKNVPAMIDDYAFLIHALLEVYEAGFDPVYIEHALALAGKVMDHFWDAENGGFYMTSDQSETIIIRQKQLADNAYPCGNSMMIHNLISLYRITGNSEYREKVEQSGMLMREQAKNYPRAYAFLIAGFEAYFGNASEIVIVGDDENEINEMIHVIREKYLPFATVMVVTSENRELWKKIAPMQAEKEMIDNKTTVYVCRNFTCQEPLTTVEELQGVLDAE